MVEEADRSQRPLRKLLCVEVVSHDFPERAPLRPRTGGAVSRLFFIADAHIGGHRGFATPTDRPGVNSRCALALDLLSQVGAAMKHDDTTVILV